MKNLFILFLSLLASIAQAQYPQSNTYGAIGNDDWTKLWTCYKPNYKAYNNTDIELSGVISKNLTLYKRNTYLLKGIVYVTDNAMLIIEPGTVIRGDASTNGTLVISKGSKIIANGTDTDPIVFTSNLSAEGRNPGDWGGIIILGNAPINKIPGVAVLEWGFEPKYVYYGGTNEDDNSGVMKYVRIEYSGRKITKTVELNGLTLAGVGKGTQIENVQISYSNDDSFEMFGGSVSMKNIISYKCGDDDLDFNYGYKGKIQNALAIRHPYISDFSGSRCIEAESYSGSIKTVNEGNRLTQITVSNLTLLTLEFEDNAITTSREAIFLGPDCYLSIENSIISGFESAFTFKDEKIKEKLTKKEIVVGSNIINNCKSVINPGLNSSTSTYLSFDPLYKNRTTSYSNKDLFIESTNPVQFNFKSKPMLMSAKDAMK